MSAQVDLWKNNAWSNILTDVYVEGEGQISISRGRDSETGQPTDSSCSLQLDNTLLKYSPRLPTSPNYGLIGRNTPIRGSNGTTVPITDSFTRSVSNGWGTATSGQTWTNVGGTASERSVDGAMGVLTPTATGSYRLNHVTGTYTDTDVYAAITVPAVSTGASILGVLLLRYDTGSGASYRARAHFTTSGTVDVSIVNSFDTGSATTATGLSYIAGEIFKVRARVVGHTIRIRVWTGTAEPTTWHLVYRHTDTVGQSTSGVPGLGILAATGNTNATKQLKFDDLEVTDLTAIRFTGEVPNWASRWAQTGQDIWVPIEAAGIRRRLEHGSLNKSALYRELMNPALPDPVAYWPCEDGGNASQAASALPSVPPMIVTGTPSWAAYSDFLCSSAVPTMGTAKFSGKVAAYTVTGSNTVRCLVNVPEAVASDRQLMAVNMSGTTAQWHIIISANGQLTLKIYDYGDALISTEGPYLYDLNGKQFELRLTVEQVGSNVAWELGVRYITGAESSSLVASGTLVSWTCGIVTRVIGAPEQNLGDIAMGHFVVASDEDVFDNIGGPLVAWQGEAAGRRVERLCEEEGLAFAGVGDLDDTELLGAQRPGTILDLLDEAADADGGILYETRYELGFSYRTRASMYNQAAVLALDYDEEHLSPPFDPVEDDAFVRNDVTVDRADGASARIVATSGPLSTALPPDGVGVYDESASLSLLSDTQCIHQAGWRVHLGTWDEARYPQVTVDIENNPSIRAAAIAVEAGDRITVSNPPSMLPTDTIDLIVQGYSETWDGIASWVITFNCTPAGPWFVGVLEDTVYGRLDTAGSTLSTGATTATGSGTASTKDYIVVPDAEAAGFSVGNLVQLYDSTGATKETRTFTVTSKTSAFGFTNIYYSPNSHEVTVSGDQVRRVDQTSLTVATSTGPLWTTSGAEVPFDARLSLDGSGGEIVTVTAISGASSPQTFTVTRAVNGVRRGWPAGTDVRLAHPLILSM